MGGGSRSIGALVVVLSAALGLALATWTPSIGAIFVVATAIPILLALVVRFQTSGLDIFEPLTIFCLFYGVMFVVRPAAMLADDVRFYELAGLAVDIEHTFTEMQVIGLVGAFAFCLGYLSDAGRRLALRIPAPRDHDAAAVGRIGVVTLVVGTLAVAVFTQQAGGLGVILGGRSASYNAGVVESSKYLYHLPTVLISATLLCLVAWRRTGKAAFGWAALAAVFVLVLIRGPVGSRLALLPLIFGPYVYWRMSQGRRPSWLKAGVGLIAALAVSAFIAEVRNQSVRQQGTAQVIQALADTPSSIFQPLTHGQDAAMAPALAAALTTIPQTGYQYGLATVGDLLMRGIPRAVWEDKPLAARDQVISHLYGDSLRLRIVTNPEFSALFAWYIDAHLLGVLFGLGLYGVLARAAWVYARRNSSSHAVLALYGILLASMAMMLRDSPIDVLARIIFFAGPLLVATWWGARPGEVAGTALARAERA